MVSNREFCKEFFQVPFLRDLKPQFLDKKNQKKKRKIIIQRSIKAPIVDFSRILRASTYFNEFLLKDPQIKKRFFEGYCGFF